MIFDSHPELAVAHEPRFLATMTPKQSSYEQGGSFDMDRFLTDLYAVSNFSRLGIPKDDLRASLADGAVSTFPDAVRVVFDHYASSRGKNRYGDKTPLYITFIEPIARLLPETRFVHLVRDGRDVTLAYLERDKGPGDIAEAAFHWRLRVTRGHEAGMALGPERYQEYRYEDLIDDPEGVVRRICDFLDLDFDPVMLDYQENSARFLAEAKNPGDHQHLTMAPTKGLIDWRTSMSPDDLALFEAIAGDALQELGYEQASSRRLSPLVVRWQWLRWQTRRIIWRVRWRLFRQRPARGPEG